MIPLTIQNAFETWLNKEGYCTMDGMPKTTVVHLMRLAYHGGYLEGYDHAKNDAIRAMADALQKAPTT